MALGYNQQFTPNWVGQQSDRSYKLGDLTNTSGLSNVGTNMATRAKLVREKEQQGYLDQAGKTWSDGGSMPEVEGLLARGGQLGSAIGLRKARSNEMNQVLKRRASEKAAQKSAKMTEVKQLAIQYRNAVMARSKSVWANLSEDERKASEQVLRSTRAALLKDDFGRKLVGDIDADPTGGVAQEQDTQVQPIEAPFNLSEERNAITGMVVNEDDKKGLIDNITDLKAYVDDLARNHGESEVAPLRDHIDRLAQQARDEEGVSEGRRKEYEAKMKGIKAQAMKLGPIYGVFYRLRKSPSSVQSRADALNRLLRDESGAAIAVDEVMKRLRTVLSDEDYTALASETGGFQGWAAGALGAENVYVERIMKNYLPKMQTSNMLDVLSDRFLGDKDVFNYMEKNYKPYSEMSSSQSKGGKFSKFGSK